jgi:hypothetical protein
MKKMFERHPERVTQEGHQDVGLHAAFELVKERTNQQLAL